MSEAKDMQRDVQREIIEKIKTNRISTTQIADCLGKTGAIAGVNALTKGHFRVGPAFFTYAYNESNWELHEQLEKLPPGHVVIVEESSCKERAIFGELVSKYIIFYKRAEAIVVNGFIRDVPPLIRERSPIWCRGVTPIGCFNRKNELPLDNKKIEEWKQKYEGAIAVCDDAGAVIIPKAQINAKFLQKLDFIELQEDIWFYCLDTKKWSTYETVCLKKYLNTELLPSEFREKFQQFVNEQQ